jgi:hypothetical protein
MNICYYFLEKQMIRLYFNIASIFSLSIGSGNAFLLIVNKETNMKKISYSIGKSAFYGVFFPITMQSIYMDTIKGKSIDCAIGKFLN